MASEPCTLVIGSKRDAFNLHLGHEGVVVILAIGAMLAPCVLLVALHGLC